MVAVDFPDTPTVGQVFDKWTWNGTAWVRTAAAVLTQAGSNKLTTNASGAATISYPTPFAAIPTVTACIGQTGTNAVVLLSDTSSTASDFTYVVLFAASAAPVGNTPIRINWIATGTRP